MCGWVKVTVNHSHPCVKMGWGPSPVPAGSSGFCGIDGGQSPVSGTPAPASVGFLTFIVLWTPLASDKAYRQTPSENVSKWKNKIGL